MTAGNIYRQYSDDSAIPVGLTSWVTGSSTLATRANDYGFYYYPNYIEDTDASVESAIVFENTSVSPFRNKSLVVYRFATGTFYTESNDTFFTENTGTPCNVYGVKKVDASTYYIYYGYANSDFTPTNFRICRTEVNIGVGYSNTLLQEITLDNTGSSWFVPPNYEISWTNTITSHGHIGKKQYLGFVRGYPAILYPDSFDVYIYVLDMEADTVTGGVEWQSNGTVGGQQKTFYNSSNFLKLVETNGNFHWITEYITVTAPNGNITETHVVVDGVDTLVQSIAPDWVGNWSISTRVVQYNTKDYWVSVGFERTPDAGLSHRAVITDGETVSTISGKNGTLYTVSENTGVFSSDIKYPCYVVSGTAYYSADPDTGQLLSPLTVSGITTINFIFPTLDTNGDMLIHCSLPSPYSSISNLVTVNPDTLAITRVLPVFLPSGSRPSFNVGNFLIQWENGFPPKVTLIYLNPPTPQLRLNEVQMMPEQN